MNFTMYDTLLQLPLFQGLGKNEITEILTKVKFHFQKYAVGDYPFRQGEVCDSINFLLSGTLMAETASPDGTYVFYEELPLPTIIELHSLYGIQPRYSASYSARTEVCMLAIDKQALFSDLLPYMPCALNYANIVSTRAQNVNQRIWSETPGDLCDRFIRWITVRCNRQTGRKVVRIKMQDMAEQLSDRRINVSRMLNDLQGRGLVALRRKEIEIPALERLQ